MINYQKNYVKIKCKVDTLAAIKLVIGGKKFTISS